MEDKKTSFGIPTYSFKSILKEIILDTTLGDVKKNILMKMALFFIRKLVIEILLLFLK